MVGAAAYLSGIGSLFGNVSPIVFGAMAEHLAIGNQRVGYLASALILSGAVRVTAPIWIRRVNWRKLSAGATLIGAVILAASGVTHSYWYALLAVGLYGLMDALYSSVAYAALGDSSNPERAYAISIVASMVLAALTALALTNLAAPHFGYAGIMLVFACIVLSGALVVPFLPGRGGAVDGGAPVSSSSAITRAGIGRLLVAMLAVVVFLSGIFAVWVFSERYGSSVGIELEFVGLSLMIASLVTAGSALLAAFMGGRGHTVLVTATGVAIVVSSLVLLERGTAASFLVGLSLFSFGWGLAQPFYPAVVRLVDSTGRLFTASPAVVSIGAAAGVALGGSIVEWYGFRALLVASATALIASVGLMAISLRWSQVAAADRETIAEMERSA